MLQVSMPTESTVRYAVTSKGATTTLAGHAVQVLGVAARFLTAALFLIVLVLRFESHLVELPVKEAAYLRRWLDMLQRFESDELNDLLVLLFCSILLWSTFRRWHTEESLLVIRGLGIQTSTSSSSYLLSSSTRFIPTTAIQDIFIHEAFNGFKVKFYLSIVVEGEDKMVVVFPNLLPRLVVLEPVWKGARACLFDTKG